jgi:hypothetical protein
MSSDILWLMIGRGKNTDTVSSSKVFEYFGTRKPVIACVPEGATIKSCSGRVQSFIYNRTMMMLMLLKILL